MYWSIIVVSSNKNLNLRVMLLAIQVDFWQLKTCKRMQEDTSNDVQKAATYIMKTLYILVQVKLMAQRLVRSIVCFHKPLISIIMLKANFRADVCIGFFSFIFKYLYIIYLKCCALILMFIASFNANPAPGEPFYDYVL